MCTWFTPPNSCSGKNACMEACFHTWIFRGLLNLHPLAIEMPYWLRANTSDPASAGSFGMLPRTHGIKFLQVVELKTTPPPHCCRAQKLPPNPPNCMQVTAHIGTYSANRQLIYLEMWYVKPLHQTSNIMPKGILYTCTSSACGRKDVQVSTCQKSRMWPCYDLHTMKWTVRGWWHFKSDFTPMAISWVFSCTTGLWFWFPGWSVLSTYKRFALLI